MSLADLAMEFGAGLVLSAIGYWIKGPDAALLGGCVGFVMMLAALKYKTKPQGPESINEAMRTLGPLPVTTTKSSKLTEEDQVELRALRRLVGELYEEAGSYGPIRDRNYFVEGLSKVQRASGTFAYILTLNHIIRAVHNILTICFVNKERGDIAMDQRTRNELERGYRTFTDEVNRLLD
jgi:hypothetical protein